MQPNTGNILTQEELVTKLRQLGYGDASVTRAATWRKLDLLPQFTAVGHGQGRGAGKERSHWSNATEVLNQAVAILDLLKSYRRLEELYLPLWQMGFAIPLERVRAALTQPLLTAAKDLAIQEEGRNAIEDRIDDSVANLAPIVKRNLPLFDVPEDTLAAIMNVLANPEYAFWDQPYEDGVSKLRGWEGSFYQRCQKLLGDRLVINPESIANDNNIFANAPFINQYLSLPHLVAATQGCTDEELLVVQRDLQLGREILLVFTRLRELLAPFLPNAFLSSSNDLTVLFSVGTLSIWIDLALRRGGFGPLLDYLIPHILDQIHQYFNEATERELKAAGPEIGKALQMFEQIMVTEMATAMSSGK